MTQSKETRDPPTPPVRRVCAETLLQGNDEVVIEFNGKTYRLRATRQGKLILTK